MSVACRERNFASRGRFDSLFAHGVTPGIEKRVALGFVCSVVFCMLEITASRFQLVARLEFNHIVGSLRRSSESNQPQRENTDFKTGCHNSATGCHPSVQPHTACIVA